MKISHAVAYAAVLALIATTGCTTYKHERWVEGKPVERTVLYAPFLTKTAINGLKSRTTEKAGAYSRSVGVDSANAEVDTNGVQAVESLLGKALIQALNAAK